MARGLDLEECRMYAEKTIETGKALQKFYEFVQSQGGRLAEMQISDKIIPINANKSGRVQTVDALGAAKLAAKLGTSKVKIDDKIDYSVGVYLNVLEGDKVKEGDLLMKLYVNDPDIDLGKNDFSFIDIVEK
jgi:thymidine phosphorylase